MKTHHCAAPRADGTSYRFPAEVIGYAVWLYFRFPLSLLRRDNQDGKRDNQDENAPLLG
jgi:transposase-like protein